MTCRLPSLVLSSGVKRLIDELKTAKEILSSVNEDEPWPTVDESFATSLCSDELLKHSSPQVRILVACCLADLFRIDSAAYLLPEEKVKDLLLFCMDQLKMIAKPDLPGYFDAAYLLENLSTSKTFLRFLHLDDCSDLLFRLYKLLFSLCTDTLDERMWNFVAEIGVDLFREVGIIPVEVMQLVLGHLVQKEQGKGAKHRLSAEIIHRCEDTLQSSILSAFSTALFGAKSLTDWFAANTYPIFVEFYRVNSSLAIAILPFICQNMKSTNDDARLETIRFYSQLLIEPKLNVAADNPQLWHSFLGRFHDVSPPIRQCCIRVSSTLMLSRPELADDLRNALESRTSDTDETIRFEVLSALLRVIRKGSISLMTDRLLSAVKVRTLDKKFKVRREAVICLSNFYKRLASSSPDDEIDAKYGWIKNRLLYSFYNPQVEDRLLCHKVLNTSLVCHSSPTEERAKKLYNLYSSVDDRALKVLNTIFFGQAEARTLVLHIIDLHEAEQDATHQNDLLISLKKLSEVWSCSYKVTEEMQKLFCYVCCDKEAKSYLRRILSLELLKSEVDECVDSLLSKIGDSCSAAVRSTARELLEWVAPVLIDGQTIDFLVQMVEKGLMESASSPQAISRHYSSRSLTMLLVLSYSFTKAFCSSNTAQGVLTILQDPLEEPDAIAAVHLVSNVADMFNNFHDLKSSLKEELEQRLLAHVPKQTKFVIRTFHRICGDDEFSEKFNQLYAEAFEDEAVLPSSLRGIVEAVSLRPQFFREEFENTVECARALIDKNELDADADNISFVTTVVACFDFFGRALIRLPKERSSTVDSCVQLLSSYLTLDKHWTSNLGASEKDQLRIAAATALLKLSFCEQTTHISSALYRKLAYLLIDKSKEVREAILSKLSKYFKTARLSVTFLAAFALAPLLSDVSAVEKTKFVEKVEETFLESVQHRRNLIRRNPAVQSNRRVFLGNLPEYCLCYAIYLLSYYPEFVNHNNDGMLRRLKNCLWFAIKPLTDKKDGSCINVTFIEQVLVALKHSTLVEEPKDSEQNKKVWALVDLTNLLLCTKMISSGNNVPISTGVPKRFFQPAFPVGANSKSYLPRSFDAEMKNARMKLQRSAAGNMSTISAMTTSKLASTIDGKPSSVSTADSKPIGEFGHAETTGASETSKGNVSVEGGMIKKRGRGRPRKVPEAKRPSTHGGIQTKLSIDDLKLGVSKTDHSSDASVVAESSRPDQESNVGPQSLSRQSSNYSLRSLTKLSTSFSPDTLSERKKDDSMLDSSAEPMLPSDITPPSMRTPDQPILVNGCVRKSSRKSAKSRQQSDDVAQNGTLRRSSRLVTPTSHESPHSLDSTPPLTPMHGESRGRLSRRLSRKLDFGDDPISSAKDLSSAICSEQNSPSTSAGGLEKKLVSAKERKRTSKQQQPTDTANRQRPLRRKRRIVSSNRSADERNRENKRKSSVESEFENVPSSPAIVRTVKAKVSVSSVIPLDSAELRNGNKRSLRSSQSATSKRSQLPKKDETKIRRKQAKVKSAHEHSNRVLRSGKKVSQAFIGLTNK